MWNSVSRNFLHYTGPGRGYKQYKANVYNKDVFLNTGSCLLHPSFALPWRTRAALLGRQRKGRGFCWSSLGQSQLEAWGLWRRSALHVSQPLNPSLDSPGASSTADSFPCRGNENQTGNILLPSSCHRGGRRGEERRGEERARICLHELLPLTAGWGGVPDPFHGSRG